MNKTRNSGLEFLVKSASFKKSPINVCFTSRSSAGAWQIRGQQIAATRSNWKADNKLTESDIRNCDILCIVKKIAPKSVELARKYGKPVIFDIVDSWAQPEDGLRITDLKMAREHFSEAWIELNADGYIFPTRRMQDCLGSLVATNITIYHHYWPQLQKNPIRDKVLRVGYEGADYLGDWLPRVEQACSQRGLEFCINPTNYIDLDVVVIARGSEHGNFLSRNFKSNVKLANAYGSGTPALVHFEEMSAHDTDCGDVLFFTDRPGSFERQLDRLIDSYELRKEIHDRFQEVAQNFNVNHISEQFEGFFLKVLEKQKNKH